MESCRRAFKRGCDPKGVQRLKGVFPSHKQITYRQDMPSLDSGPSFWTLMILKIKNYEENCSWPIHLNGSMLQFPAQWIDRVPLCRELKHRSIQAKRADCSSLHTQPGFQECCSAGRNTEFTTSMTQCWGPFILRIIGGSKGQYFMRWEDKCDQPDIFSWGNVVVHGSHLGVIQ